MRHLFSIVNVILQLTIVYQLGKWVYIRFIRGRFHIVDGKVIRAHNADAARQLSKLENIVRHIVHATFGSSKRFDNVRFGIGDTSNAGVTKGKSRIELCLTGSDDEDALMVVALHEAAHALNHTVGHDSNFIIIQQKLINAAQELGFIKPFKNSKYVCNKRVTWPIH
jgi:hypothetical protein